MNLPPLRDVVARYGLTAKKSLGQNFLFDLNLTGRIARAGGPFEDLTVVEVGPGPGGLTRGLIEAGAKKIVVIERDRRCLGALQEIAEAYPGCLEVIEGDALEIELADIVDGPIKIVANLPYNIATALAVRWLHAIHDRPGRIVGMILMFQKEVAARIVARPSSPAFGRISVLTQWLCEVRKLFDIAPTAFVPPPSVVSTVVEFTPRQAPSCKADMSALERTVALAFNQRRKMLRSALRSLGDAEALLRLSGIEPTRRAETLSVEEFCRLSEAIRARR